MKNKEHRKISLKKLTITKLPKSNMANVRGGSSLPPSEVDCHRPTGEIKYVP